MPREYLRRLSDAIVHAQRPIRVLRAINSGPKVHERFFRHGARAADTAPRKRVRLGLWPLQRTDKTGTPECQWARRRARDTGTDG